MQPLHRRVGAWLIVHHYGRLGQVKQCGADVLVVAVSGLLLREGTRLCDAVESVRHVKWSPISPFGCQVPRFSRAKEKPPYRKVPDNTCEEGTSQRWLNHELPKFALVPQSRSQSSSLSFYAMQPVSVPNQNLPGNFSQPYRQQRCIVNSTNQMCPACPLQQRLSRHASSSIVSPFCSRHPLRLLASVCKCLILVVAFWLGTTVVPVKQYLTIVCA
jgi:hypothetical protein